MAALGTILKWAILAPVLLAVVLLAVANVESVTVHLNPFDAGDPVLQVTLRLYQLVFAVFVVGALIGGFVVWLGQRRYRRAARAQSADALPSDAREGWVEGRSPPRPAPAAGFLPRPEG